MATETAAFTALTIAVAALLFAVAQFIQQLTLNHRGIGTGGLTKGRIWRWHWRQFRFAIKDQAVVVTLPAPIYSALRITPTVRIDTPSQELWMKAMKLRDGRSISTQSCWISFVQDLVMFSCIGPDDISVEEESQHRTPDGLAAMPNRVDALSVLLTCIAMGMQVYRYSPTKGEIALGGGVGGISSSTHPVFGCLLHYSFFTSEQSINLENTRRHGRALRQEKGVWANAIFGRFMDRSSSPAFTTLDVLRERKLPILRAQGWPEDSYTDTIGGAACFMAFAHVDVYEIVPPSVVRPWCAHFAEVIVKAHHLEIVKKQSKEKDPFTFTPELFRSRQFFIDKHGCSSPYLPWEYMDAQTQRESISEKGNPRSPVAEELLRLIESTDVLAVQDLVTGLTGSSTKPPGIPDDLAVDDRDPSVYTPMGTSWEIIMRTDQCMRHLHLKCQGDVHAGFTTLVDKIVATAISPLSEAGAPSWEHVSKQDIENFWSETFPAACRKVLGAQPEGESRHERGFEYDRWVPMYARLSILRAAYYTIMMRASRDIGPGLTENSSIDTALVYMAG